MADKSAPSPGTKDTSAREARLKQALKANLARRKAQARARADTDGQGSAAKTGKPKG